MSCRRFSAGIAAAGLLLVTLGASALAAPPADDKPDCWGYGKASQIIAACTEVLDAESATSKLRAALLKRANAYFESYAYALAVRDYDRLESLAHGLDPESSLNRGKSLERIGDRQAADRDFDKVIQTMRRTIIDQSRFSDRVWAYQLRASAYVGKRQPQPAVDDLNHAIDLAKDAELYDQLCRTRALANYGPGDGLAACNAAIHKYGGKTAGRFGRGITYLRLDRFDEALDDFNAALKAPQRYPDTLYLRGVVEARKGLTDLSSRDLARARTLDPTVDGFFEGWGIAP